MCVCVCVCVCNFNIVKFAMNSPKSCFDYILLL